MRRRLLVLAAAIGLLAVASLVVVERATRPAGGSPEAPPAGVPLRARPEVPGAPAQVRDQAGGATSSPPGAVAARGGAPDRRPAPAAAAGGGPRLEVSFRLDPRLTSGLHMGDRWVSPRTYTRSGGSRVTVEARARAVGGPPGRARADAAWTVSEPDMVEISPERGDEVRLTVWRPGECTVTVSAGGASTTLSVRAAVVRGSLRVDLVR